MLKAYKKFWTQYADFKGRTNRPDYWWTYLANFLVTLPFIIFLSAKAISVLATVMPYIDIDGDLIGITEEQLAYLVLPQIFSPSTMIVWLALVVFGLATLIPHLAILVRRLRDAGFHWALVFVGFIPYIGGLTVFVLTLLPTKAGQDKDQLTIGENLFD